MSPTNTYLFNYQLVVSGEDTCHGSKIERNEVDINIEKLQKITSLLEVKAEDLLSESVSFINNGDNNNYFSTIYHQSTKIEKLYEEQIALLKDKIEKLEAELVILKTAK